MARKAPEWEQTFLSYSYTFYRWQQFSALSLTSSPEYHPAGTHFFAGRRHSPCNTSMLEAHCGGTVSGWKHDINCNGLKNLSVYRATVTSCEGVILFLLQQNGSFWQWRLLSQEDARWKMDIGLPGQEMGGETLETKWGSWVTVLEEKGYLLPALSWR